MSFNPEITLIKGKQYIYDIIRKKNLLLTPEEWIRQHFIYLLIEFYKYPKSLIQIEGGLKYNNLSKRTDILVYDRNGNPFLLVECKAEGVPINNLVLEQVSRYNLMLKSKYYCVTNGKSTFCFEVDIANGTTVQLKDIPAFLD